MNKQWHIQTWNYSMSILWGYSTQSAGDSKVVILDAFSFSFHHQSKCIRPKEAEVNALLADAQNPGVTWLPRNLH